MTTTTPTGGPIEDCEQCGKRHPTGRRHCSTCGSPSRFIDDSGLCLGCRQEVARVLERTLCATCGHVYGAHEHPGVADDPERLTCYQEDDCEAFVPSDVVVPESTTPPPHEINWWPNNPPAPSQEEIALLSREAVERGPA